MQKQAAATMYFFNLVLLTSLISVLPGQAAAQGIKADARLISPTGSYIFVDGNLDIQQSAMLEGSLSLTGNLIDDFGLEIREGRVRFEGAGHDQLLSGNALSVFNELMIGPQSELVVAAGKRVTVNGELQNNNEEGGLRLLSDNIGSASLIHASQHVHSTVQRYFYTATGQYHMLSSPVSQQLFEPEFYHAGVYLYLWYEPYAQYTEYSNQTVHPTFPHVNNYADHFLSAMGYYVQYPPGSEGELTKAFEGFLHQGETSFKISSLFNHAHEANHNFIGNPYASAIDWNAEEGWSGKEHLAGGRSKHEAPAWVWSDKAQNFGVIHPRLRYGIHNDIRSYILPMTAFWVLAAPGSHGEMLTMDDRVRVHQQSEEEKKRPGDSSSIIRISISLENESWRDEVLIEYHHDGEPAGAAKLFSVNPSAPQLYVAQNDKKASILFLSCPEEQQQIPLGHVVPVNSNFFLDAYVADDLPIQLILHDRLKDQQHALDRGHAISFRAANNHAGDRFVLNIVHRDN